MSERGRGGGRQRQEKKTGRQRQYRKTHEHKQIQVDKNRQTRPNTRRHMNTNRYR